MKNRSLLVIGLLLIGLLTACGSGDGEMAVSDETAVPSSSSVRLTEAYDSALPIQSQLAVGTLQLEETAQAVDETVAAELLPLWQAAQSLSNSDTTAAAEVTAVLNQIQRAMTADQIAAIAAMQLTQDSVNAMVEAGELSLGRGGFGGAADASGGTSGFAPPDGLPGGGGPGSGQGGGPGGGFGGALPEGMTEDDLATRRAEREAGGTSGFQDRAMTNAVILLLQTKTGEAVERVDPFAAMWVVLNEATGLTTEEIQAQTDAGATLAELIEANGGDVTAVHAELVEALADSPIAQRQDVEQYVTNLLNGAEE